MQTRALRALLALLTPVLAGADDGSAPLLHFAREGKPVAQIALRELRARCGATRVEVQDPYYGRRKQFHACPLGAVLSLGFGLSADALARESFLFRARDGYVKPAAGTTLAEPGGFLAFGDAERSEANGDALVPHWEPIDRRQVDPGPFYLVWTGAGQSDPHRYPWPYQLERIEIAPFESVYPHTVPHGAAPGSPAARGYALFQRECSSCHSVNREGGTVGPELNVPRNVLEYRDREQLRAFIRDPQSFRYTTMPPHTHLRDTELDAILAYLDAMRAHKHDPGAAP